METEADALALARPACRALPGTYEEPEGHVRAPAALLDG